MTIIYLDLWKKVVTLKKNKTIYLAIFDIIVFISKIFFFSNIIIWLVV